MSNKKFNHYHLCWCLREVYCSKSDATYYVVPKANDKQNSSAENIDAWSLLLAFLYCFSFEEWLYLLIYNKDLIDFSHTHSKVFALKCWKCDSYSTEFCREDLEQMTFSADQMIDWYYVECAPPRTPINMWGEKIVPKCRIQLQSSKFNVCTTTYLSKI